MPVVRHASPAADRAPVGRGGYELIEGDMDLQPLPAPRRRREKNGKEWAGHDPQDDAEAHDTPAAAEVASRICCESSDGSSSSALIGQATCRSVCGAARSAMMVAMA